MPEGDHGLVVWAAQGARQDPGHLRGARLFPRWSPLHSARLSLLRVARVSLIRREEHGPIAGSASRRMKWERSRVISVLRLCSLHGCMMNLLTLRHVTVIICGARTRVRVVDVAYSEAAYGRHVVLKVPTLTPAILQLALGRQAAGTGGSCSTLDIGASAMARVAAVTSPAPLRQAMDVNLAVDLKVDATLLERSILRHLDLLGRRGCLVVARARSIHSMSPVTPRRGIDIERRRVVGTVSRLEDIATGCTGTARCLRVRTIVVLHVLIIVSVVVRIVNPYHLIIMQELMIDAFSAHADLRR